jgi:hypothetical protein
MNYKLNIALLFLLVGFANCKKEGTIIPEQTLVHFQNQAVGNYYIQNDAASLYKVPIGSLTVADKPRTITYSVTSPTGATAGTHYTIENAGSVTIPAGSSTAFITVKGNFTAYPTGRKDTLRFAITGGDLTVAEYNKTFDLIMQKYCAVDLASMSGAYTKANDNDGSPLYTATIAPITAANLTSATTGYIMVTGLWGVPNSGPIRVNLDWTDPGNFKADIPTGQPLYVHSTYGQAWVRPAGSGSFSSCSNTLTLKYQVYVGAGSFAATTTLLSR